MKSRSPIAAVLVLALASVAAAQSFDARVGFRNDHANNGTPLPVPYLDLLTLNGPIELQSLFGPFNAQGFSGGNRGLFNFIGTVTLLDPAGSATIVPAPTSLRTPYNFANIVQQVDPFTITFDANRGIGAVAGVPWIAGEPAPAETYTYPAHQGGPDAYFPGFRFVLSTSDHTARRVTITVSGVMQAVDGWFVTGQEPPTDISPGFQDLLPAAFISAPVTATLVVDFNTPSPAASILLALGGVTAARRRRASVCRCAVRTPAYPASS